MYAGTLLIGFTQRERETELTAVLVSGLCRIAAFQKWKLHFALAGSMELTDRSIDKKIHVGGP